MKRILLLLITLTTFMNVSYASFPITENNTCEVLSATNIEEPDDEDEPSLIIYVLRGFLLAGLLFFLLRLFWKSLDHKSFNDPWYRAKFIKFFSGLILIFLWPLGLLYLLYLLYKEGRDSSNRWYKGVALVGTIVWLIGFALFLAFALTFGTGFSGG
jgi:H+/Cl- antiporter ClcA